MSFTSIIIISALVILSSISSSSSSLTFDYPSFTSSHPSLSLQGTASLNSSSIWLTSSTTNSVGRLLFSHPLPVPFISFSTHFTFHIITSPSAYNAAADGLAFFISPSHSIPPKSAGEFLGIYSSSSSSSSPTQRLFAVEFDTFKNSYDPSASHIAVDVDGVESPVNITDTSDSSSPFYLYGGYVFRAWIQYEQQKHQIRVYLANCSLDKRSCRSSKNLPAFPILTATYDLSTVFVKGKPLYVGLSAATGSLVDSVEILSWGFSSRLS